MPKGPKGESPADVIANAVKVMQIAPARNRKISIHRRNPAKTLLPFQWEAGRQGPRRKNDAGAARGDRQEGGREAVETLSSAFVYHFFEFA